MHSLVPHSPRTPTEMQRDPFGALRQEINDLFSSFSSFPSRTWSGDTAPRLDVSETDSELDIDAELPGVDEKDIEVTLAGDTLTIRGERKNEHEQKIERDEYFPLNVNATTRHSHGDQEDQQHNREERRENARQDRRHVLDHTLFGFNQP